MACAGDRLYIDLCDDEWRVVEVNSSSWRVLDRSPVRFVRPATARRLPAPVAGGSLELLEPFINVREDRWPLVYGFLLGCFAPRGPFLHLALIGEQGTAKSTTSRILRSLVDPSTVPLKQPPRDEEQLLVAALNNKLLVLDNISGVKPEISDGLCRLSTGGGFSKRKLYTDGEEFAVDIQRPAILNGIDDIATRPDLSERTITLELEPLQKVRPEADIWEDLEAIQASLLGAICDCLSAGMEMMDTTVLINAPRMADAATWIQACEHGPGQRPGAFLNAFHENQREAVMISLESHPVPRAVIELMENREEWAGTATELLNRLGDRVDEQTRKAGVWPKSPDWLTKTLRRFGRSLRTHAGIEFSDDRTGKQRTLTLRRANPEKSRHSRHGVTDKAPNDANDGNDANKQTLHGVAPTVPPYESVAPVSQEGNAEVWE